MNANLRTILSARNLETHINIYKLKHGEYSLVVSVQKGKRQELIQRIKFINEDHIIVAMKMVNNTPEVCLLSSKFKKVYDIERGGVRLKQYHPFDSTQELNKQGFIFALKKMIVQYTS